MTMMTEQEHNNVQWRKVKLEDVCAPSSEKYNPLTENDFSFCIEMENINQESGTINGKSDITKLLSLKNKFHKGEVLYGKLRPYLRKYWLSDCEGACSTEIWVLKSADGIDNQFLFYIFQSDFINKIANLSSGTKMPRADWAFMKNQQLFIPFKNNKPHLSAQRRIAAILASADKVIAATQKTIAKYKQMKQGMMEDLLKPKEGWKMVKLGECLTIGNGQDYKHLQNGEIPVYGTGGIMTYVNDCLYEGETVCIGRKGTINKPMYYSGKIWTVDTLFYTHSFVGVMPQFIYYVFCNIDWNKYNEATGVPSLSKETIYKIEIPVPFKDDKPYLPEQRRIAAILSGIDAKIAAEEKVMEKYEKVKKGLMERMLNEKCEIL